MYFVKSVESRRPLIHGRVVAATGAVGNGAGQVGFSYASGPQDDHILPLLDPVCAPVSLKDNDLSRQRDALKTMFSMQALSLSRAV